MDINIPKQENVDINKLKVDGNNPNLMSEEQRVALKKNLEKFGFIIPIITNKDYLIADGQHRFEVAKELNMKQVPIIALPIKEVDRRILRQVLNKLRGQHDEIQDLVEYQFINDNDELGNLAELLAIEEQELYDIIKQSELDLKEEEFEPESAHTKAEFGCNVREGEVWQLGDHRLMCGNSINKEQVLQLLNEAKVDMLCTDPP